MKNESKNNELIAYPFENIGQKESLILTKLTQCLKYTFENSIGSKNIIVVYPENIFRPATYLSYLFMKNYQKDVLFFTPDIGEREENPYKNHLEKFCLLQEEGTFGLIWHYYLPCVIDEDSLKIELIFRKGVRNKDKSIFKSELKEKLENKNITFNKLIFSKKMLSDESLNEIKDILFGQQHYKFENKLGLCIFENLSNKIFTENDLNSFSEWLKQFEDKGVKSIFHLSNYVDINLINRLKEKTNSIVFYLCPDFLYKGEKLFFPESLTLSLSSGYNIDSKRLYIKQENLIEIIPIDGKGLSTKKIKNNLRQIEKDCKIPDMVLSRIKKLLFILPKLTVHPSSWGRAISYKFEDGEFRTITIKTFFEELDNYIAINDSKEKEELAKLRDSLIKLYCNLEETDRVLEEHPYSRKTKPYIIIELVKKLLDENKEVNIVIAVYDGREKNILYHLMNNIFKEDGRITVKTINQISYLKESSSDSILILPSFLVSRHFSEYFKGYKKIFMLAYKGLEEEQQKKQLDLIKFARLSYVNESITFFKELYISLKWKQDKFIERINELKANVQDVTIPDTAKDNIPIDVIQYIKERILKDKDYTDLKEDEALFEDSNDDKLFANDYQGIRNDFRLTITSLDNGSIRRIELPKSKSILKINEKKEINEVNVNELELNDLIVLIQGDERKSFVDYIAKRSGIDEEIDLFHIKNWKDKLNEFMETENLDDEGMYKLYEAGGGHTITNRFEQWRDSVQNIAPLKKEDLITLGKIIRYEYLIKNIDDLFRDITKLRTSHRLIGREINKVIKDKLSGKITELTFDEFDLSHQFEIFKIEKIEKTNGQSCF